MAPKIVPFTFGDRAANHGESMSAACAVTTGDHPLTFNWFHNGMSLAETQDVTISTSKKRSYLEIDSVTATHAGEYICTVSNEAGTVSQSTILVVNGNLTDYKTIFFGIFLFFKRLFEVFLIITAKIGSHGSRTH